MKYFFVLDSISARQINKIKYGVPIIEDEQHANKLEVLDYYKSDKKALIKFLSLRYQREKYFPKI